MKIKTLLAAASAMAFMSTSAHAIEISFPNSTATPATPSGNVAPTPIAFVEEIPAASITTGNIVFNVDIDFGFVSGAHTGATMVVVLPGGYEVDAANVNGSNVGDGDDSISITAPGVLSVSTNSVQYSFNTANNETSIGFSIPVKFTGCDDIGTDLAVAFRTSTGAFINGGPASVAGVLAPCESFASGVVTADTVDTDLTLASGFRGLSADITLGTIEAMLTPNLSIGVDNSGVSVPLTTAQIASVEYEILIDNGDSVAGLTTTTVDANDDDLYLSNSTGTPLVTIGGGPENIDISLAGFVPADPALAAKTAVVQNGEIALDPALNPTAVVEFSGALQTVTREAQPFGPFDWVSTVGTDSIFRVTGLPAGVDTPMNVVIDGHFGGVPVDAVAAGVITANDAGEAFLTSFTGFGLAGIPDFNQANVIIEFELPPTVPVDIDRLLLRNGQVFDFGDTNNNL